MYHSRGLTLVEVLVVVAITAILVSIAVPSYQRYLQRGHRAEAVRAMLEAAACQERVRAGSGYYDTTRCAANPGTGQYRLTIEPRDNNESLAFTILGSPVRPGHGDYCGTLTLNHAGTRGSSGDPARLADCWNGR